jgi:hypothetical protein
MGCFGVERAGFAPKIYRLWTFREFVDGFCFSSTRPYTNAAVAVTGDRPVYKITEGGLLIG